MKIIIATKNKGKLAEFKELFSSYNVELESLLDYPNLDDIEETGTTFKENAIIKAETISKLLQEIVIADDSGLIIDALDGRPGIYSARYAGEGKSDEDNLQKVMKELKYRLKEENTAHFHCTLAIAQSNRETITIDGRCDGLICEKQGQNGFGYDPIFYIPHLQKTMAQLTKEEKNIISHRAKALSQLFLKWDEIVDNKKGEV